MSEQQTNGAEYELTCPSCGSTVSEHDASCNVCGQHFFACPDCSTTITGLETQCPNCGVGLMPVDMDELEDDGIILAMESDEVVGANDNLLMEPRSDDLTDDDIMQAIAEAEAIDLDDMSEIDGDLIRSEIGEVEEVRTMPSEDGSDVSDEEISEVSEASEIMEAGEAIEGSAAETGESGLSEEELEILDEIDSIREIDEADEYKEPGAQHDEPAAAERGQVPGYKEDPHAEVRRKFYQPQIEFIQSFMVLLLFTASLGFILGFTLLEDYWYDNFDLYNSYLMIVSIVGVSIALGIIMTAQPEAPALVYNSRNKKMIGVAGGIVAAASFAGMTVWGPALGSWNVLMNLMLIYGILGVIQISPTLSARETAKLTVTFTGLFLILLVPVHEALGPWQTEFTSLPWAMGNELLFVAGITIVAAGFASLRTNTSFLAIWLFGALVLFLVPFHEMAGIVPSANYEPWDHMLAMIGIVTCAAGSIGFLAKKTQYDGMAKHLDAGNGYFETGAYDEALAEYEIAHGISIQSGIAMHYNTPWYSMGDAMAGAGRPEEALPLYEVALAIDAEDEIVWANKANCLAQLKRYTEALACYNKAIEINDRYVDGWFSKGGLEKGLGKLEMAEESFTNALDIYPDYADAWLALGQVQSDLGMFDDAHKSIDEGRELEPREMKFRLEKARVFRKEGKLKNAEKWLDSVLEYEPDFHPALIEMADVLYEMEDYEGSLEHLYAVPEEKRWTMTTRILEAKNLIRMKHWEDAAARLWETVEKLGMNNELLFLISLALESKLEELEELNYTDEITGLDIDRAVRWHAQGDGDVITEVMDELAANKEAFRQAVLERRMLNKLENRDLRIIQSRKLEATFGELDMIPVVAQIQSEIDANRRDCVDIYRRAVGRTRGIAEFNALPKALEFYDSALEKDETILNAYKGKIEVWLNLKRFVSAINTCDEALDKFPGEIELWNMKGEAHLKLRNYPEALTCFEECISLNPGYTRAWLNKGNTYVRLNRLDTAMDCFGAVLQIDPEHLPAIRNRNIIRRSLMNRASLELMQRDFIIDEAEDYIVEEEVVEETVVEEKVLDDKGHVIDESKMVIGSPVTTRPEDLEELDELPGELE